MIRYRNIKRKVSFSKEEEKKNTGKKKHTFIHRQGLNDNDASTESI